MLYIILAQGFCPLKIKITQFPGGFCLKVLKKARSFYTSMLYPMKQEIYILIIYQNSLYRKLCKEPPLLPLA